MPSYWSPSSSSRESDYYRPNATLNLDRPPRPGPRQPDSWRPDQSRSPWPIKKEEQSLSPDPIPKRQKVKQAKLPNPNKQPLGQRQGFYESPEVTNEVKAQKLRQMELSSYSSRFLDQSEGRLSTDNSRRLNSYLNQPQQEVPKVDTKAKRSKNKPPKLPNANLQPLGKRQMGVINSIMRVEEQQTTRVNGDRQLGTAQTRLSPTEPQIEPEVSDEMQSIMRTPEHSPPDTHIHPERLRHILSEQSTKSPTTDPSWQPTSLPALLPDSKVTPLDLPPTTAEPSPRLRQKLDFGNRVDQCLLKMDKWADAWLSNALTREDPNPDTDNAWNSFEYCLSMPDILEEGEIVEYEEVPRQTLPVEDVDCRNGHVHPERLAFVPRVKRKRHQMNREQTGVDDDGESWLEDCGSRMGSAVVASVERSWMSSEDGSASRTLTENSSWTSIQETRFTELGSSSPEEKRTKITHIPSAATLREEARRLLQ